VTDPGLEGRTWHYGLVARWWAGKVVEPVELAFYRDAIRRYGEPALDLGCGTGRVLVPLREEGVDVDGVDLSEDMLAWCRLRADAAGVQVEVQAQPMHRLDLHRRYRTIFICDSFGIGGSHRDDRETLQRIYDHLEPGGALVFSTGYPYEDAEEWGLWLPHARGGLPEPWPETGGRQELPDGDILEQRTRLVDLDPRGQRLVLGISSRLLHDQTLVAEEERELAISVYLEQELRLLLELAGFTDVRIEAGYSGRLATADDADTVVIATKAG
jgi:SAM-dependent methyltransferase